VVKFDIYLLNTIEIKKDLKVKLSKQSENYQIILNAYLDSVFSNGSNTALAQNTLNSVSQYDGGFLDKFTTLIEEKSGVKYKQSMLDRRLKVLQKNSDVDSYLLQLECALLKLKEKGISDAIIADVFYVNSTVARLLNKYDSLLSVRDEQVLGSSAKLYEVVNRGMEVEFGLKSLIKQMILVLALTFFYH
jgi:hypothetical protein